MSEKTCHERISTNSRACVPTDSITRRQTQLMRLNWKNSSQTSIRRNLLSYLASSSVKMTSSNLSKSMKLRRKRFTTSQSRISTVWLLSLTLVVIFALKRAAHRISGTRAVLTLLNRDFIQSRWPTLASVASQWIVSLAFTTDFFATVSRTNLICS